MPLEEPIGGALTRVDSQLAGRKVTVDLPPAMPMVAADPVLLEQLFVNLFDNGGYLLNVSVNGVPLTQLSASRPHTPVFLGAGMNDISAANGLLSIDHYFRDGGDGTCVLP